MFLFLLASCGKRTIVVEQQLNEEVVIYPDYKEVTIPANIAPLNISLLDLDDAQLIIDKNSKSITIPLNSDLANNNKVLNFYKSTFNQIIEYKNDFDFGNPLNKKSGISGEAYIYELLLSSGNYKRVKWQMLSEDCSGETFEYNGKIYNIKPDDSHYDILVETYDNHKIYIEVKSTKKKFGKKVPFYLSQKQIEMISSIKSSDKYVLAVVFDVNIQPKHFFMVLNDNLDKNI